VRRLWDEFDLHVAAMLVMSAPAACLGWWGLAVPLLISQGRIGTRAFVDYSAFNQRPWNYLATNELLAFGFVALLAGARFAIPSAA
jgi:hypothetical protein